MSTSQLFSAFFSAFLVLVEKLTHSKIVWYHTTLPVLAKGG